MLALVRCEIARVGPRIRAACLRVSATPDEAGRCFPGNSFTEIDVVGLKRSATLAKVGRDGRLGFEGVMTLDYSVLATCMSGARQVSTPCAARPHNRSCAPTMVPLRRRSPC